MKCFEATNGSVKDGVPVTWSDESFVAILTEFAPVKEMLVKALVADSIKDQCMASTCGGMFVPPGRIARANMDVRSQLWLSSETADTAEDALVLVHSWFHHSKGHGGEMKVTTKDAEILAETTRALEINKESKYIYVAAWVRVRKGGSAHIVFERKNSKPIARLIGKTHSFYSESYHFRFGADGKMQYEAEFPGSKLV